MKESLHFHYDGIYSKDMGVVNVSSGSGLFEETFIPSREIKEVKIFNKDKPYFQGLSLSPLSFSLRLFFDEGYDEEKIRSVARWLNTDYYKPLVFESNPSRIYYAMLNGESKLSHTGCGEGYVDIEVRCDSPYSYSPEYVREYLKFTTNEFQLIDDNFSTNPLGNYINTEIIDGNLVLIPSGGKWIDHISSGMKWSEII